MNCNLCGHALLSPEDFDAGLCEKCDTMRIKVDDYTQGYDRHYFIIERSKERRYPFFPRGILFNGNMFGIIEASMMGVSRSIYRKIV